MSSLVELQTTANSIQDSISDNTQGIDDMWLLITGTLVFFMQAGFAMLEAGSVRSKNVVNILFKNLIDGAISAISFWILGYGFAYGDTARGFIGKSRFGLADNTFDIGDIENESLQFHFFFFQWAFAATAATIVSGCVAERCKLEAYFIYSFFITVWIYPVIVHWCWGEGWLSAFGSDVKDYLMYGRKSNNFVDFAGSGVVHMVGGVSGLIGAMLLGPREGRFREDGSVKPMPGHSSPMVLLGTIILWVGWYGFNPGSTLAISGDASKLASKVAVVTTISAASSALTMVGWFYLNHISLDLSELANAVLAGLVGVTGPCAVIDNWAALCIGVASCLLYIFSAWQLLRYKIDDPLNAFPIHGFVGAWGVLAVGIFGNDANAAFAGYVGSSNGFHPFRTGEQFGVQVVGLVFIIIWTAANAFVLFKGIDYTMGLRVSAEVEMQGLDKSEHGNEAYTEVTHDVTEEKTVTIDKDGNKVITITKTTTTKTIGSKSESIRYEPDEYEMDQEDEAAFTSWEGKRVPSAGFEMHDHLGKTTSVAFQSSEYDLEKIRAQLGDGEDDN